MDKYFIEDVNWLIKNCSYLEKLKDKTILITGATGLIGSLIIKVLLENNKKKNSNINIIALSRNKEKFEVIFKDYIGDVNLKQFFCDVNDKIVINEDINYIIHTAAITKSKLLVQSPVETTMTAIYGTNNILELAKEKKIDSMVYLSSMEIYGTFLTSNVITEDILGDINLKNVRSGYPESKRMCEYLCNAYCKEYNVNVKSARLAQTFGAGVPLGDTRIFSSIADNVINNKDIILHTKGLSEANYCYIADAINAIFTILFKGLPGESYNVVNEECHATIKEMAEMVCRDIAKNRIKVVYDIPEDISINGYAPDTKMKLCSCKLRELGWSPKYGLLESFERLINSYIERMK